jgi:hypothetical protein
MSIFTEIIGGNLGKLFKDIVGSFKLSPEEKLKFEAAIEANNQEIRLKEYELERVSREQETALIEAQKSIIISEMQQDDKFTKRARPSIVYAGLGFIFLNHVFIPIFAFFSNRVIPNIALPTEFWVAWSSVIGIWAIGRSAEKPTPRNVFLHGHAPKAWTELLGSDGSQRDESPLSGHGKMNCPVPSLRRSRAPQPFGRTSTPPARWNAIATARPHARRRRNPGPRRAARAGGQSPPGRRS